MHPFYTTLVNYVHTNFRTDYLLSMYLFIYLFIIIDFFLKQLCDEINNDDGIFQESGGPSRLGYLPSLPD